MSVGNAVVYGSVLDSQRMPPKARALICFSHLRWGFVWQRPQHLLARFARDLDVNVVEEPEIVESRTAAELRVEQRDGVTVMTPLLPPSDKPAYGFNRTTNPAIARLLTPFFRERGLLGGGSSSVILWYYTPMALGAAPDRLDRALVVYDVMDELANFRGAPAALREREAALLARADLVFAGGPSLYASREHRHPRVYCFPSGVDAEHFANGKRASELDRLAPPIVGFYGVIDERMDLDLVAGIADLRPRWTIVMIGPTAKIAREDLPSRPNIFYPGKRDYADLPSCLACFDAAILPFARNDATRFISPTKTLEYLAAGKPVVSTPIRDVIDLYGSAVEFGETPGEFVDAIERLWSEPAGLRQLRRDATRRLVAEHSWDEIVAGVRAHIDAALTRQATQSPALLTPAIAIPNLMTSGDPLVATTAD
ncbi:MAG: UDP-galactopyranose mutase [Thermomicrobiales bacterium]|nr:UDP-galactopyranose mutase [Thermomicrobiales bacterium]